MIYFNYVGIPKTEYGKKRLERQENISSRMKPVRNVVGSKTVIEFQTQSL